MAEIASFGVDVDENTKLAQNAQDTANTNATGIKNTNDPNKLSPAEKATLKRKYDTDVLLYGMDTQKLTDNQLSTSEIDSTMNALTTYMTPFFADMTTTDTVDRSTLDTVYSNFDTADKDSDDLVTSMVSSTASEATVAASNASVAGSEAIVTGNQASTAASNAVVVSTQASVAGSQAVVTGNQASTAASNATIQASEAQSSAVVAQSSASSAIEIAQSGANATEVVSEEVTTLKGGSTMTVAELESGLQTKISTSDANTLVDTKTDSLAETMVKSSDFASYKDQTAGAITQTVSEAVGDISNRNLALSTATPTVTVGQNEVNQRVPIALSQSIPANQPVNVSFDIVSTTAVGSFYMQHAITNNIGSWKGMTPETTLTTALQHISTTTTSAVDEANTVQFRFDNITGTVTVTNLMVVMSSTEASWLPAPEDTQSEITQTIDNASIGFKNADGTSYSMNLSADGTALMDVSKLIINGQTSIMDATIGTAQIANLAVTNAQIGNEAVGTAQIEDAAVNSAKIANLAVGTAQIGDGAITNAKIGKLAVGTAQIANAAITDAQVGNISANHLTAGTIDFNTITGKNINASNITTGTLSTDRLNVGKLSALSANLGDVTTGSLKGVDIVAKTFSTPNGSFTTDASGAITAKNMTLMGGTLSSPTINASTINSSTINGTMFNAGSRIDNSNNTSNWYPLTINPDGDLTSTHIENGAGLQTYISGGTVNTRYNRFATNGYGQYTSNFISMGGDGSIAVTSNGTTNKDTAFNAPIASTYGAVYITPGGISLHGDNESLRFRGTSKIGTNGMRMDNYGNVHGEGASKWWRVYDSSGSHVASFGTAPGNNIAFLKPLLVDEIGGHSSNNGHALLIHGDDAGKSGSTGQMAFKKDSRSALVTSASIYNRTYSSGSNVYITSHGTLGRSTSASKYKYNIKHAIDEDSLADKLLTMHVSTWNDKHAVDSYAQTLTDNTESEDISIKDNYGLIAEDLRDAGLDMFVEYGKNHTIEGIEYDRAWLPLLPKMRQMNDKINEYELRISKLEAKINE